ncbi:hypothetical protein M3Y98_00480000 [Aphelenchoides besseyi]|nr:hypothetical protein M3Y98_00480000 [Aphelenchoides besseyi]KAI6192626.1 hypothetical protein M3Y96_01247000 [Aphelenchoides besseyi]
MSDDPSIDRLPPAVVQAFMLDDGFFSPFMRQRIPELLFTNGSSGLGGFDNFFPTSRPSSSRDFRSSFDRSETPTNVRSVPIRVVTNQEKETENSWIEQPKTKDPTESLSFETLQRRTPSPLLTREFPSSRQPSSFELNRRTISTSPPTSRKFESRHETRRSPSPSMSRPYDLPPSAPIGLRRTVTSNSTASLPQPSSTEIGRRESEPALILDEAVSDSSRPPSRGVNLMNRSKSPSLASLRRKANFITPSCFRGEKDRNDERLAYTPTASRESLQTPTKSVRSIFWPSRTSSTPSLVQNTALSNSKNKGDEEIVDPVEAAIRSLESFDPNECFKPPTTTNGQFRSTSSINTLRDDNPTPRHASAQSSDTVTPTAPVRLRYTTPLLPSAEKMGARNSSLANQTSQNRHELPPRSQRASDPQPENKESRSRAYRSHLTECVKRIEIGALRVENFASLPQWRDADQLRRSLPTIHETLIDVEHAISELINSAARLSFQRNDPEFNELQRLTDPLRSAHSLLSRLRRALDQSNWSISSLSRPVRTHLPNDPLDQIVAILRHLPADTSRFAQWIYGFLTRRDRTVLLPHGISSAPPPPFHSRENYRSEHQTSTQNRTQPPKTPTVHFATPLTYGRDARSDIMDGGSTTSSNSSPREDESSRHSESTLNRGDNDDSESVASQIVIEEDDLASVVSDMAEHPWTQNNNRHTTIDRKSHNADTRQALEAQKHHVDVDLAFEDPTSSISRRQALMKIEPSGRSFIYNLGEASVYVDRRPIRKNDRGELHNNSMIEIGLARLLFARNEEMSPYIAEESKPIVSQINSEPTASSFSLNTEDK